MSSRVRARLFLALILVVAFAFAHPPIKAQTLSKLKAQVVAKVTVLARAQAIAVSRNATVAVYGGTDREVSDFVINGITKYGSEAAFAEWLERQDEVHLVDWHKLNSDLDIILIPNEGGRKIPDSRMEEMKTLKDDIARILPGSTYYRKMDMLIPQDFFVRYPPQNEHFEAISNVATSHRGLEKLEDFLSVDVPGRTEKVNLAEWGLQQMADGRFEIMRNPMVVPTDGKSAAFQALKQALRWIRYYSERPDVPIDEKSKKEITELLRHANTHYKAEINALLRDGDQGLRNKLEPESDAEKIVDALEKLQLYSCNSERTHALLSEVGISDMAKAAEVYATRILSPLAKRKKAPTPAAQRLGKAITVHHFGPIQAVQSMQGGALWKSNNVSIIKGYTTEDAQHQDGVYAQVERESAGRRGGYLSVDIELSLDAIVTSGNDPDADIWTDGKVYVIKTLDAIARHPDGSLKISPVTFESLLEYHREALLNHDSTADREKTMRGLVNIIEPESNSNHAKIFNEILGKLDTTDQAQLWRIYLQKAKLARAFFNPQSDESDFYKTAKVRYLEAFEKNSELRASALFDATHYPTDFSAAIHRQLITRGAEGANAYAFVGAKYWDAHPQLYATYMTEMAKSGSLKNFLNPGEDIARVMVKNAANKAVYERELANLIARDSSEVSSLLDLVGKKHEFIEDYPLALVACKNKLTAFLEKAHKNKYLPFLSTADAESLKKVPGIGIALVHGAQGNDSFLRELISDQNFLKANPDAVEALVHIAEDGISEQEIKNALAYDRSLGIVSSFTPEEKRGAVVKSAHGRQRSILQRLSAVSDSLHEEQPDLLARVIEIAGKNGDVLVLTQIQLQYPGRAALEKNPELSALHQRALEKAVEVAVQRGDVSEMRHLVKYNSQVLREIPQLLRLLLESDNVEIHRELSQFFAQQDARFNKNFFYRWFAKLFRIPNEDFNGKFLKEFLNTEHGQRAWDSIIAIRQIEYFNNYIREHARGIPAHILEIRDNGQAIQALNDWADAHVSRGRTNKGSMSASCLLRLQGYYLNSRKQ